VFILLITAFCRFVFTQRLSIYLVASQIPVSVWHEIIGKGTIANAILDRIVHSSHKIQLKGKSLRKKIN